MIYLLIILYFLSYSYLRIVDPLNISALNILFEYIELSNLSFFVLKYYTFAAKYRFSSLALSLGHFLIYTLIFILSITTFYLLITFLITLFRNKTYLKKLKTIPINTTLLENNSISDTCNSQEVNFAKILEKPSITELLDQNVLIENHPNSNASFKKSESQMHANEFVCILCREKQVLKNTKKSDPKKINPDENINERIEEIDRLIDQKWVEIESLIERNLSLNKNQLTDISESPKTKKINELKCEIERVIELLYTNKQK